MEKHKFGGVGPAASGRTTLGHTTRDAPHFKLMALHRDFERVRATVLRLVGCSAGLQMFLQLP